MDNTALLIIDCLEKYSKEIQQYGLEGFRLYNVKIDKYFLSFNVDCHYTDEFFKLVANLCASSWIVGSHDTNTCTIKTEWKHMPDCNDFRRVVIDIADGSTSLEPIKNLLEKAIIRSKIDFRSIEEDY